MYILVEIHNAKGRPSLFTWLHENITNEEHELTVRATLSLALRYFNGGAFQILSRSKVKPRGVH